MTIHIHRSDETGWTKLSNAVLRDPNLTLRAKGLLVQLLSHEDGWQQSLAYSEKQCVDGKASIRGAFAELQEAGYATRERHRDQDGRTRGWDYDVYDVPAEVSGFPNVGETNVGETKVGMTNVGEEHPLEEPQLLEDQDQEPKGTPSAEYANPNQPTEDQLYLAREISAKWMHKRKLDIPQVVKLNKEFGRGVVTDSLRAMHGPGNHHPNGSSLFAYLAGICNMELTRSMSEP